MCACVRMCVWVSSEAQGTQQCVSCVREGRCTLRDAVDCSKCLAQLHLCISCWWHCWWWCYSWCLWWGHSWQWCWQPLVIVVRPWGHGAGSVAGIHVVCSCWWGKGIAPKVDEYHNSHNKGCYLLCPWLANSASLGGKFHTRLHVSLSPHHPLIRYTHCTPHL